MPKPKKCITYRCPNNSKEGRFVGNLCGPCYDFITTGRGVYSTLFKNARRQFISVVADYLDRLLNTL